MKARVFYTTQQMPIIITLGTTSDQGTIRKDLKALEKLWEEPCGAYLFYIEKDQ